jgi:hypothetical protein
MVEGVHKVIVQPFISMMHIRFPYIKGTIHYEFILPEKSKKHPTFKLLNVHSSAFTGKHQIFGQITGLTL